MLIYLTGWGAGGVGEKNPASLSIYCKHRTFCKDKDLKSQTEQIQLKKVTKEIVTNVPHP